MRGAVQVRSLGGGGGCVAHCGGVGYVSTTIVGDGKVEDKVPAAGGSCVRRRRPLSCQFARTVFHVCAVSSKRREYGCPLGRELGTKGAVVQRARPPVEKNGKEAKRAAVVEGPGWHTSAREQLSSVRCSGCGWCRPTRFPPGFAVCGARYTISLLTALPPPVIAHKHTNSERR